MTTKNECLECPEWVIRCAHYKEFVFCIDDLKLTVWVKNMPIFGDMQRYGLSCWILHGKERMPIETGFIRFSSEQEANNAFEYLCEKVLEVLENE